MQGDFESMLSLVNHSHNLTGTAILYYVLGGPAIGHLHIQPRHEAVQEPSPKL